MHRSFVKEMKLKMLLITHAKCFAAFGFSFKFYVFFFCLNNSYTVLAVFTFSVLSFMDKVKGILLSQYNALQKTGVIWLNFVSKVFQQGISLPLHGNR